jgi:sialate O-acetylesterase
MVLQQSTSAPIWGWSDPGAKVSASFISSSSVNRNHVLTAAAIAGADGKWTLNIATPPAGGPYSLMISDGKDKVTVSDILVGEVWLASGQSNMDFTVSNDKKTFAGVQNMDQEIAAANYPQIRFFTVDLKLADQPQQDVTGHWEVCSPQTVGEFSAVAYFFARDLYQDRKTPFGIIDSTWGASSAQCWISRQALVADHQTKPLVDQYETLIATWTPDKAQADYQAALTKWQSDRAAAAASGGRAPRKPGAPKDPHQDQHNPYLLYNGMIDPVKPYAIRGVIWYQGESNGPTANIYGDIMTTLIADWRNAWENPKLPFFQVQLAFCNKALAEPVHASSQPAKIRFAQFVTSTTIPNAGMATAVDIGDAVSIHPKNKQEVGRRLALVAQNQVYGEADVEDSGPAYESASVEGSSMRIKFSHIGGGLVLKDITPNGFAISGDGKSWQYGDAKIDGDTIVVSSAQVLQPTAVRYAWGDNPPISLYNKAGLPASPFKTDAN